MRKGSGNLGKGGGGNGSPKKKHRQTGDRKRVFGVRGRKNRQEGGGRKERGDENVFRIKR